MQKTRKAWEKLGVDVEATCLTQANQVRQEGAWGDLRPPRLPHFLLGT